MDTESYYFWRVGLSDEPDEALYEQELREMLAEIDRETCPVCGNDKMLFRPFCSICVDRLPAHVRSKLFLIRYRGDVDTFDEAKALLRLHAQIQEAKIDRIKARYRANVNE